MVSDRLTQSESKLGGTGRREWTLSKNSVTTRAIMQPVQYTRHPSISAPVNPHVRRDRMVTIPDCPPVCMHENRLLPANGSAHPLAIYRQQHAPMQSREEAARNIALRMLKGDTAHFQDCHGRNIQPSSNWSGIRVIRSLPPVLASLNASLGTNLVYCHTQHEFAALLDAVITMGGEWRGGALVGMHGDAISTATTGGVHHVIGVHMLNRNGMTVLEAFDSIPDGTVGHNVSREKFEQVVLLREGVVATYIEVPVQVTGVSCGIHAIHILLSEYDAFTERAASTVRQYCAMPAASVDSGSLRPSPELVMHVETQSLLKTLGMKVPLAFTDPLPPSRTTGDISHVDHYFDAHLTKKPTESYFSRSYVYSDSIEKYMLTLLEGAVHWMEHGGAKTVMKALDKVCPHNRGEAGIRKWEVALVNDKPFLPTFRQLPVHAASTASAYWNPERYLASAQLPVRPTAVYLSERGQV